MPHITALSCFVASKLSICLRVALSLSETRCEPRCGACQVILCQRRSKNNMRINATELARIQHNRCGKLAKCQIVLLPYFVSHYAFAATLLCSHVSLLSFQTHRAASPFRRNTLATAPACVIVHLSSALCCMQQAGKQATADNMYVVACHLAAGSDLTETDCK